MEYQLPPITMKGKVDSWHLDDDGTLDYGILGGTDYASVLCTPKYNRRTKTTTFHHVTVYVKSGFENCTPAQIADELLRDTLARD